MSLSYKEGSHNRIDGLHVHVPHRSAQACEALSVTTLLGQASLPVTVRGRLHAIDESIGLGLVVDQDAA